MTKEKNFGLEHLLALNGDRYFVDEKGEFEVIFKAKRVAVKPETLHGVKYSLVLLNAKGKRVVCFDNAHAANQGTGPSKKHSVQYDHKHTGNRVIPYKFQDALTLLEDFLKEVDKRI